MANLGRGDQAGTSLAAATAAIISARWNAASRGARVPQRQEEPLTDALVTSGVRGSATVGGTSLPHHNQPYPSQPHHNGNGGPPVSTPPSSPSMFTPVASEPAPDMFASPTYATDIYTADTHAPDAYTPDACAPDAHAPDTYTPDTYTPETYAPDAYAPDTYTPNVPTQRAPEPSFLDVPVSQVDDVGFTGSVMSDLAFPEPFIPEPYQPFEPTGYEPNGQARDGRGYEPNQPPRGQDPLGVDTEAMLPQRVPGAPDVPEVLLPPNDPLLDPAATPAADGFELTRIATYLRDDRVDGSDERPDGFDLAAVLEAVRGVPDVRDAQLRWNSGYGHTLRIEFFDGVEEGQVTREVARLLREKMGLAAQPNPVQPNPVQQRSPRGGVVASAPVGVRTARIPAQRNGSGPRGAELDQQAGRPLPPVRRAGADLPRVVLDHVQVTTVGVDATVEVRMAVSGGSPAGVGSAVGKGHGPAVDAYLLRLAANAAVDALDQLLTDQGTGTSRGRCFVEHVAVVPFAGCEVAVVVLLLVCGSFAEQLAGSAIVAGDPRQAVVRATLSAANRRLESLLG